MDILEQLGKTVYNAKKFVNENVHEFFSDVRRDDESIDQYVSRLYKSKVDLNDVFSNVYHSAKSPDEVRKGLLLILKNGYKLSKDAKTNYDIQRLAGTVKFIKDNEDVIKKVLGPQFNAHNIVSAYVKAKPKIFQYQVAPQLKQIEIEEKVNTYLEYASLGLILTGLGGPAVRIGASLIAKPLAEKIAQSLAYKTLTNVSNVGLAVTGVGEIIGQYKIDKDSGVDPMRNLINPINAMFIGGVAVGGAKAFKNMKDFAIPDVKEMHDIAIKRIGNPITEHLRGEIESALLKINENVKISPFDPAYKTLEKLYPKDVLAILGTAMKNHLEEVGYYRKIKVLNEKAVKSIVDEYKKRGGDITNVGSIEDLEYIASELYREGNKYVTTAFDSSIAFRISNAINESKDGKILVTLPKAQREKELIQLSKDTINSALLEETVKKITDYGQPAIIYYVNREGKRVKQGLRPFYMPSYDDFIVISTKQNQHFAIPEHELHRLPEYIKEIEGKGLEVDNIFKPGYNVFPYKIEGIERKIKKAKDKVKDIDEIVARVYKGLEELKDLSKTVRFKREGRGFVLKFDNEKDAIDYYISNRVSGYDIFRSYPLFKRITNILDEGKSLTEGHEFIKNFLKSATGDREFTSLGKLNRKLGFLFTALSPQISIGAHISDMQLLSMLAPSFKYRLDSDSLIKGLKEEFSRFVLMEGVYGLNKLNPTLAMFKGIQESVIAHNLKNPQFVEELSKSLVIPNLHDMVKSDFQGTVNYLTRVLTHETPMTMNSMLLKHDKIRQIFDSISPWTEYIVGPTMLAWQVMTNTAKDYKNLRRLGKALGWTIGAGILFGPQGIAFLMPAETSFNIMKNTTALLSALYGDDSINIEHKDLTSWILSKTKIKELDPEERVNIYRLLGTVVRQYLQGYLATNSLDTILDGMERTLNVLSELKYTGVISPSAGSVAFDLPYPVLKVGVDIIADIKRNPTAEGLLDSLTRNVKLIKNFVRADSPELLATYPKKVIDTTLGQLSFFHFMLHFYDRTLNNGVAENLWNVVKGEPKYLSSPITDYSKPLLLREYRDLLDYNYILEGMYKLDEEDKIVYLNRVNKLAGNIFKSLKKQEGSYEDRERKVRALGNALKLLTNFRPELRDEANEVLKELYSMGYKINIWEE